MKIILVFPPIIYEGNSSISVPIGLYKIATALMKASYRAEIIDLRIKFHDKTPRSIYALYKKCAMVITESKPDVIGFSTQCSTYPAVLKIAKLCKRNNPKGKIVFGGPHASIVDIATLENFKYIDFILKGEGEISFVNLIHCLHLNNDLSEVKGISYISDNKVVHNLPEKPIEHIDDYSISEYIKLHSIHEYQQTSKNFFLPIEIGRGCTLSCISCFGCEIYCCGIRRQSIHSIINEITVLYTLTGCKKFFLVNLFTLKENDIISLCAHIKELRLGLSLFTFCQLSALSKNLIKEMASCAKWSITINPEKNLMVPYCSIKRKVLDIKKIEEKIKYINTHKIKATIYFPIGYVKDTKSELDKLLKCALKISMNNWGKPMLHLRGISSFSSFLSLGQKNKKVASINSVFRSNYLNVTSQYKEDLMLARDFPNIFYMFYNVVPLNFETNFFEKLYVACNPIIKYYPLTYSILCKELRESPVGLFVKWLAWYEHTKGMLFISPSKWKEKDVLCNFIIFVKLVNPTKNLKLGFLYDISRYETGMYKLYYNEKILLQTVIEVNEDSIFLVADSALIWRFKYNVPLIINKIKKGRACVERPKTTYVLASITNQNQKITIRVVNKFVYKILRALNGKLSVKTIMQRLNITNLNKDIIANCLSFYVF